VDNIKAYYRKAAALKAMMQYGSALQAAEQGQRQATNRRQEVSSEHVFVSCSVVPLLLLQDTYTLTT